MYERIVIVGLSGSGKTTLARQVAVRLAQPHVELDALFWNPNWQEALDPVFRERVDAALSGPCWVMDGNYSRVRDLTWGRADTIVWLDYPLPLVLRQLFVRTIRRTVTQEELWSGNRERFAAQFCSRDSLFVWAFKQYRRHRPTYAALFAGTQYAHCTRVRLHSPRETQAWLAALPVRRTSGDTPNNV